MRNLGNSQVRADEIPLWLVHDELKLNRCFACGGSNTITPLRADAEAAQSVVADAFYRSLPASSRPLAQGYPGRGRKLLAFADSRQSAAYFAPYLETSNREQVLRRLIYQGLRRAESKLGDDLIDADSLVSFMLRQAEEEDLFPDAIPRAGRRELCLRRS